MSMLVALLSLALLGLSPAAAWAQSIKMGAVVPLTGRYGAGGAQIRAGYEFAVERINASGGIAVGGVKIDEPAADLAILLAIVSSLRNRPLPAKLVVFGEIGLAGEVRPVQRGQERLREAAKLGFGHAVIPRANLPKTPIEGIEAIGVDRVEEATGYDFMGQVADPVEATLEGRVDQLND